MVYRNIGRYTTDPMTKLPCDLMCGKKITSGRMLGVRYILSTTTPRVDLPMVLCMDFAHGFGHDGIFSMVFFRFGQGNYGYVVIQG